MTFTDFTNSLKDKEPPMQISQNLKALLYDKKGDWDKAHTLVDGSLVSDTNWVHAYLHRKEGDDWNANYWYRRAKKERPTVSLQTEWKQLVVYFLDNLK